MLTAILSLVSLLVLAFELWTGIAVTGFSSERDFVERSESPGPYWLIMSLHTVAAVGLPLLSFQAGL